MPAEYVYMALDFVVLLFSLSVHECAHAWMANKCGDDTAQLMGRITLNPIAHIDPIGTVVMPLFMMMSGIPFLFGWAKPVPVNPGRFNNYRRDDILVSLAGIASNLMLALFAAMVLRIIIVINPASFPPPILKALFFLMQINVVLAVFNLIPIPPLDGSHVLFHYLPPDMASKFRMLERYGFILLILLLMSGIPWSIIKPVLSLFMRIAGLMW
jgi:Zn-dependent protease